MHCCARLHVPGARALLFLRTTPSATVCGQGLHQLPASPAHVEHKLKIDALKLLTCYKSGLAPPLGWEGWVHRNPSVKTMVPGKGRRRMNGRRARQVPSRQSNGHDHRPRYPRSAGRRGRRGTLASLPSTAPWPLRGQRLPCPTGAAAPRDSPDQPEQCGDEALLCSLPRQPSLTRLLRAMASLQQHWLAIGHHGL